MIFVDTSFLFALFAREDKNHSRAVEALKAVGGANLSDSLLTTDHVVFETITLVRMSFPRSGHERAVFIGRRLYDEVLARIYRTSFGEQKEAFEYLSRYDDKRYSSIDCLSFVVMLKLGISEALTFDSDFAHRFVVRPGSA